MRKTLALCVITVFSLFSCSNSHTKSESKKTVSQTIASGTNNDDNSAKNGINSSNEDIILTMPIMIDHPFYFDTRDLVQEFNDADNGYKIVLKDYAEGLNMENVSENTDWDNYNLDLTLDIMKGGELDIIPNIFTDPGKFHAFTEKGAFADLNPFIDDDGNLNRSELFDEVLQACEINGELRYMPVSFTIDTLAGPSKYVGNEKNWTFEEMKERWEKMPEGSTINGHTTKDYVYYALLRGNISSFIDYDKAECHFDSDEFINILDFLNSFENLTGFKQEINGTSEELVSEFNISGFMQYHQMFWRYPAEEITFVGYPSDDGCGSFFNIMNDQVAVSATSAPEKQKGAWEFISMLVWKSENASMTIENIKPEDIQPTFFKIIESVIKNECSKMSVDEILVNRTVLSKNLNAILKETADTWGLKISSVNITNVVVSNDSFMRNMALPKEIEIERQAKLAQIEKDLAVELKNIERETEEKLASLKSDKIIGEEKENVNKVLEEAEKKRIYDMSVLQKSIEEISAEIEKIKAKVKIENEADKTRDLMIAEAEGLEKRIQVISAYSKEGLDYETLRALPDIYKNINVGDVTLFQGENAGEIPAYGYIANSLLNMVSTKNAPKVAD